MNQVQEKAFHLLEEFIRICDEVGLQYFLLCGSALGAIKYKGFIPWDDDIDVGLFRDDYNSFCEQAPSLLPKHIFLQNYHTDPAFPAIYSKLRDSTTTCIESSVAALPINHGISIDVFPLDGYPKDRRQQFKLELHKKIYVRMLSIPCIRPERWKDMMVRPFRILGVGKHTAEIADMYTKYVSSWCVHETDIVANHGNWQGRREYHQKMIYGKGTVGEFEGLSVRLPANYDGYLRQKYGDYMQELPAEQRKSHHRYLILDSNHAYMNYIDP